MSSPARFDSESHVYAWLEFWKSYDLDQFDDLFLEDARLTYFSSEKEGLIHGYEAVREHHVGFDFVPGGRDSEQELWVENLDSSVYESGAIVTATWFFGDRNVEPDSVSRGPMTAVYVWDGSSYKIAHMHFANY